MSLFSFLVGAGVGAASTYLYKDQEARERAIETSKTLKQKTSELITAVREKATTKKNEDTAQPAVASAAA